MALAHILAESPRWQLGRITQHTPLHGGLTNQNHLLETASDRFVLRINNPNPERFGINRATEAAILNTIAGQSFAPAIVYTCPQHRYLISHFIAGKSFAQTAPSADEREALVDIIHRYQQLAHTGSTINYAHHLRNYYQLLAAEGKVDATLAADWQAFAPLLSAFEQSQWQPVLCHHDLVPENILRSDTGLKIIDWEYASNGHPQFDLLSLATGVSANIDADPALQRIIHWTERLWQLVNLP